MSMLAGLTTNVELLMLALDLLVEAEQLVSSTGAGVVLLVSSRTRALLLKKQFIHFRANGMSSSYRSVGKYKWTV